MAPDVAHLLGRIRMRQCRYDDAVRIMEPNPERSDIGRLDLALCYVKIGEYAKARAFCDSRLITDHNSAFGDVRRFVPRIDSPNDLEGAILWCKGVALSDVGRPDEAVDCYATALRRLPGNPLLAARLGAAATNAGRFEEAARAYGVVQASNDARMRSATRQELEGAKAKTAWLRSRRSSSAPSIP